MRGIDFATLDADQVTPPAGVFRLYLKNGTFYYRKPDGTVASFADSGQTFTSFLAADDLVSFDPVTVQGELADSNNLAHYGQVIGLVVADTLTGFVGDVILEGELTNSSWSWSPGVRLFLNGTSISSTPVTTGFSQMIGVAKTAMTVIIQPKPAIKL